MPDRPERAVFDAHFHVIDRQFPLTTNRGYRPPPFSAPRYRAAAAPLGIVGGAVVAGSFQGTDQAWLRAALRALGPTFVAVAQLPATASDEDIRALDAAGVRAVRFNLRRGRPADWSGRIDFALRVHELVGWHAEVYVDGSELAGLEADLRAMPKLVVDHLGLRRAGHRALLRLVEAGARVKATGFGRLDFEPAPLLRAIASANPAALLFGTDLPSTRAPRPFRRTDLDLLIESLASEDAQRALYDNAVALYRPSALIAAPRHTDGEGRDDAP